MPGDPHSALPPILVWLRNDLRTDDNPVLAEAAADGRPVIVVHVDDELSEGIRPLGGAGRWWLERSLAALAADLARLGSGLVRRRGGAVAEVSKLIEETGAVRLIFAHRSGAAEARVDRAVEALAAARGVAVTRTPENLLISPDLPVTGSGTPYRVFTPYWRAVRATRRPRPLLAAPTRLPGLVPMPPSTPVADREPAWASGLAATWTPGEAGARARLVDFLDHRLAGYASFRDRPDLGHTSGLSAHLRFGEISVERVASTVLDAARAGRASQADVDKFLAEIGWREFSHHLLHQFPDLATAPFQPAFAAFPWRDDPDFVEAWRRGRTGYPLVDAGMRELWATGTMHNRVRMVAASFLIKHGLVDWRIGEAWFWDTLVDACPANNPAGWQWVAGSGADAAPFFRIFNPVAQGEKFDPDGVYVRRWLPELAGRPTKAIHAPYGIAPIVDHGFARARALAAHAQVTRGGSEMQQLDLI